MSYFPVPRGCCKATRRPSLNDRHWGHWRWLNCLPQARYVRALRLWNVLSGGKRPRGVSVNGNGVRIHLEE